MAQNNYTEIYLIGRPDFYFEKKSVKNYLNLNQLFWEYAFDYKKSAKLINIENFSVEQQEDLKYLLQNLKLSFALLKQIKIKDIGVDKLLFAFNIAYSYFKILEKYTGGICIPFFDFGSASKDTYTNTKDTIHYNFILSQLSPEIIQNIMCTPIIRVEIYYSVQIIQLDIIQNIFKQLHNTNVHFEIHLGSLLEYENKHSISKMLKDSLNNIKYISFKRAGTQGMGAQDRLIYGKRYRNYPIFNLGCDWRKCTFCNIGKFSEDLLDKELWEQKVEQIISEIKRDNVGFVNIMDPSITVEQLVFLSQLVIKKQLRVKFHLRTRFSSEFTPEVCQLLGKAGMRYLGIGLESASTRLNNLMGKYDEDYDEDDFNRLVDYCEEAGIKLHYYTIFGFPTETRAEIKQTQNFLLDNMKKHTFFSYTAGLLGINKGTTLYNTHEKYGITFNEVEDGGESFIQNYQEKNFIDNYDQLESTLYELNYKIFFKADFETLFSARTFFQFIERSHIFHVQKMVYSHNPYHQFFNQNVGIDSGNYKNFLYTKNKFIQIKETNGSIIIINWITLGKIQINLDTFTFLKEYNDDLTVEHNVEGKNIEGVEKGILDLIDNYVLIKQINNA